MKKIIYTAGITFLGIIIILNLIFTAKLDNTEQIIINTNNLIYITGLILQSAIIYLVTKLINQKLKDKKTIKKIILIITFGIYIILSILWLILVRPGIGGDSVHVSNLAQTISRGNLEEFLPNVTYLGIPLSEYIQAYPQQITLSFIFNCFFKIINYDKEIAILRLLNLISNVIIVIALYKITTQISKKHETNKPLFITLLLTFISLPMLSTFVYGDTPSLAFCLLSIYFIMKYTETEKIKYSILAIISCMIAYMMRMNTLIFIIATTIYLVLNLFEKIKEKTWKQNIVKVVIIVSYIVISIIPSTLIKNYYLDKYNLSKEKSYPFISYILMSMEESRRGNGWYNEAISEPAIKDPEMAKKEYPQKIKERITYFSKNIGEMFKFYTMKLTSMWSENTYSAIYNNITEEGKIEKINNSLTFYQKATLILISTCSIIALIQNRKKLSLEIIFLITIFIGGFAFHILWEAKSRYIIPYIIVLIPISAIKLKHFNIKTKLLTKHKNT